MEIKRVLIDTNIYIEFMKGNEEIVKTLQSAEIISFSVISIAELLTGFKDTKKERDYLKELDDFLNSPRVLIYDIDTETSEFYAKIYDELKKIGTPIPTNDLWIGSLALQHGTKLLTLDSHFKNIPGIFFLNN
jgi:tRNA(fMet)-specific endonuclease VapC